MGREGVPDDATPGPPHNRRRSFDITHPICTDHSGHPVHLMSRQLLPYSYYA